MGKALDRAIIEQIIRHMRSQSCMRPDGVAFPSQYPLLAEALVECCEPYRDPTKGRGKYRPLATELPTIAEELRFASPLREAGQSIEATMEIVKRACIDMGRGKSRSDLAPAMIAWLWRTDEQFTRRFFKKIGFDIAAALAAEQPEKFEALGAANRSEYTIHGQLESARTRLILIAQNHWHLVSPEDRHGDRYWPLMLDALKRRIDIDVVAMHPDIGPHGQVVGERPADAISVWSLFMNAPQFSAQLAQCWTRLEQWGAAYRAAKEESDEPSRLGAFRAFGAYFTPTTISVIDPDLSHGVIVVSPRTSDSRSASRPQFAIHKQDDPEGFTHYWSYVENAFSDQLWVKLIG